MDFNKFAREIGEWQDKTFPDSVVQDSIAHLKSEVLELEACPNDGSEIADIIILAVGIAEKQNIDICQELTKKFEINKNRKWGIPDENGIIRHID